jgi:hypothetical protein
MAKKIPHFPRQVLEYIARVIAEYRTWPQVYELFSMHGYNTKLYNFPTNSKKDHIYAVFKWLNDKTNGQYEVAKVIQIFCDPAGWIDQKDRHRESTNKINRALIYVLLQLNEDGKLVIAEKQIVHPEPKKRAAEFKFFEAIEVRPIFTGRDIGQENDLCFVLMPFAANFDRLYKDHIKVAAQIAGFRCVRADDIFSPSKIIEDIWTHIYKSRAIIADVTGRNPNVFYEVGIAHTVGKPVILIAQAESDVPFDIAGIRYFVYTDDEKGWQKLQSDIIRALKSI